MSKEPPFFLSGMNDAVLSKFAGVLGDREWRLNHLYWVESKMVKGGDKVVRFRLNRVQNKLHRGLHHRNAILKSRQMGISTYLAMLALDCMLFVGGFHAGIPGCNRVLRLRRNGLGNGRRPNCGLTALLRFRICFRSLHNM